MSKKMTCQVLLMMILALGSVTWGVEMPKTINRDRDLKSALRAAKTPEDHLRIAAYCRAKAERLDTQATDYEQAAAAYRSEPMVKNLISPTTPGRYEYMAKGFREEAQSSRQLAESQEQMAKNVERASR
jgi:hypothetical protein